MNKKKQTKKQPKRRPKAKKQQAKKKLTKRQIDRIFALRKKGLSERQIAEKIGCSRSGVNYHLSK